MHCIDWRKRNLLFFWVNSIILSIQAECRVSLANTILLLWFTWMSLATNERTLVSYTHTHTHLIKHKLIRYQPPYKALYSSSTVNRKSSGNVYIFFNSYFYGLHFPDILFRLVRCFNFEWTKKLCCNSNSWEHSTTVVLPQRWSKCFSIRGMMSHEPCDQHPESTCP